MKLELKRLLALALPILCAQLAQMGMGVTDTLMAGRYGSTDLAGVALGGALLWPCMMLMMGFLQAVTPTVAQLKGADKLDEVGEVVRQALWLSLMAGLLITLLISNSRVFYQLMAVDPAAVAISLPYLKYASFGIPAVMGYFVLRFFIEGLGFTRPAMFVALSALMLKIPLNYWFIHGGLGLPAMGGVGCGLATAIVMWFELIAIVIYVTRGRFDYTGWRSRFTWPERRRIWNLLYIGVPIGATHFFEIGLFTLITILLGRFGADVVASHTIAMNVGGITFMFPLALGIAASIRIGYSVGAERFDDARQTAKVAMAMTLVIALVSISAVVILRHGIANLFSNDQAVVALAASLMLLVAIFQLFDNCQATAIGCLRGYKDTRVPMLFTLGGYWGIGLPLGAALGFGWMGSSTGVYGFWIGLIVSLGLVAAVALARLIYVSTHSGAIRELASSH